MEKFLTENQMYIVLGVVLLVWIGIAVYLFRLDKRVTELENITKGG